MGAYTSCGIAAGDTFSTLRRRKDDEPSMPICNTGQNGSSGHGLSLQFKCRVPQPLIAQSFDKRFTRIRVELDGDLGSHVV